MSLALYELAYRPEIQDRLRREIDEVLKKHDGVITYNAIHEMSYLDQVVNGI
jgi:cytochrome P450 family 6